MTVKEVIEALEKLPSDAILKKGFRDGMSARAVYNDVAFSLTNDISVEYMLDEVKYVIGKTFQGYKGGEFTMYESSDVWIAEYGYVGEPLTRLAFEYMINDLVSN